MKKTVRCALTGLLAFALVGSGGCVPQFPAADGGTKGKVAQAAELQQGWNSAKTRYYADGVAAVGSGGNYAMAAARALKEMRTAYAENPNQMLLQIMVKFKESHNLD